MKIAYTMAAGRGDTDLLLAEFARRMIAAGRRVVGVAQINTERDTCHPCDMDVQVLPDGPVIRISQNLGAEAKGCRLDPAALEGAVGEVASRLRAGADVLVLNKFGKHEAEGRGFRDLIGEALELGVPVISGLNEFNRTAYDDFSSGLAVELPGDLDALTEWLNLPDDPEAQAA